MTEPRTTRTAPLAGRVFVLGHLVRLTWRTDRTMTLLLTALMLSQTVAVALTGLSQRWLVDSVGLDTLSGLVGAVAAGAVGYALTAACGRVQANILVDLSDRVDVKISEEVLTSVATIPSLDHLETPGLLNRLSVLRRGTPALSASAWRLADAAATVTSVVISVWLLMDVSVLMGLLALLTLPPLWTGHRAQAVLRAARDAGAEHQRLERGLHHLCVDSATSQEARITGAGAVLDEEADRAWTASVRTLYRADLVASCWRLAGWACFTVSYLGALALVLHLALQGSATLGDLMLALTLGSRLRSQVRITVDSLGKVSEACQALSHYLWLRAYAREARRSGASAPRTLTGGIRLDAVSFTYPGAATPALTGIDLDLRPGTTVALVGDNGAGKSTLVNLLIGMHEPTGGTMTVDGVPVTAIAPESWRDRCTGAFQDFVAFELTARESVAVGAPGDTCAPPEAVDDALRRAGADRFVAALPDAGDTQLGRVHGGVELSRGQWQRVALARAFVRRDAALMVLDEPTAALDPQAEHDLYERFTQETGGRESGVTVLVTHRFSTVYMADHIVVLEKGRVSEQGTHDALMDRRGRYWKLFTTQARGYTLPEADRKEEP
ncbi:MULTISPECIES: ABC transporter ATP-binding protein [Streptomyces]|uniref:ABC transporter ATP-binding protein n=1 Tax=Streptomyces doudnae TaxID=3075536 RepID=A0ABD5EQ84_9ACTN|nr:MULTISPECIES: ABC transporter ATP-binding protein [unclassified Streptomyces]MDT0436422.1 ABC transporter ATP-binding protein [Streptomyces sp. DSM 41981]MYQ65951.1 ATP-binding cassette domain-containing protein [Streptomyces sp. SID4950]SCE10873.1 ATP-binding cassette, subfamily B [Streptomyces sp. SolWspMP-5a-2]